MPLPSLLPFIPPSEGRRELHALRLVEAEDGHPVLSHFQTWPFTQANLGASWADRRHESRESELVQEEESAEKKEGGKIQISSSTGTLFPSFVATQPLPQTYATTARAPILPHSSRISESIVPNGPL